MSKNEQKSCNLQTLTKARVFNKFQSFLCVLVGKRLVYKTAISDFQDNGFAKKNIFFSKTNFFKILIFFFVFKNIKKTGIYVLDHYIVHVHTKFQADIIFGSHFVTLKRCCPSDGSMVHPPSDCVVGYTVTDFYAMLRKLRYLPN